MSEITSQSIREAIDKLQGLKSEPLVDSMQASEETIDIIKQQFPSRIKDSVLTYMYGIRVDKASLPFGVVKMNFNDGNYKLIKIA